LGTEKVLRVCVVFIFVTFVILQCVDALYCPRNQLRVGALCVNLYIGIVPPIFKDIDTCNCYVHSCSNCGHIVLLNLCWDIAHGVIYMINGLLFPRNIF